MEDSSQESQPIPAFADRIFGRNPFPEDDPRHQLFETNARYAAEEFARWEADTWKTLPANKATSEEFLDWTLAYVGGCFDIFAGRLLVVSINGSDSVILYEQILTRIVVFLRTRPVSDKGLCGLPKEQVSFELQIRLKQRQAHWMAEAFKLARGIEETGRSSENQRSGGKADLIHKNLQHDPEFQRRLREGQEALEQSRRVLKAANGLAAEHSVQSTDSTLKQRLSVSSQPQKSVNRPGDADLVKAVEQILPKFQQAIEAGRVSRKKSRHKRDWESAIKNEGITSQTDIDALLTSKKAVTAAAKSVAAKRNIALRTVQNAVSRSKKTIS